MTKTVTDIVAGKFNGAIKQYNMLDGCTGILVGYSGGADSSALLRLLYSLCRERNIHLLAVHVHHGIRGDEADRDAEFCRRTCEGLGVDFKLIRADIPALARETGRGIEETARDFRYSEFERLIKADERLSHVAVAHNSDDNAETMIFNLVRGCGVDGLSGIVPIRPLGNATLIRPLITVQKREILGYCDENGIEYIIDSTNADTAYTRNYIRAEIIPRLEELNPSFLASAERLSGLARADSDCLDRLAAERCTDALSELNSLDTAIASRVVIRLFAKHSPATLEGCHVSALLRLAAAARENSSLSLPGGIRAEISRGRLLFVESADDNRQLEFEYRLSDGVNQFTSPDFAVLLLHNSKKCTDFEKYNERLKNIYKLSIHAELNSDKINHILYVRSRRDGDAYVFGGMTRRLKKLYNDRKLSKSERERLPVFCDPEGIVWVPGFNVADRAAADSDNSVSVWYYYNPAK